MTAAPLLTRLGELFEQGAITAIQDGNHGEKHPKAADYAEEGIPFIMANNISNGSVDLRGASKISLQLADTLRIGFAEKGDVLLTHKGTIGNTAVVEEADPYLMLTPQVTYYRTEPSKLLNYYLRYAFEDPFFQKTCKSLAQQGTRPYIGITAQRKLRVKYWPLSQQRAIVGILKPYDDLIEINRRRMQLLERSAQLLYKEWFVHLRFPGHEHVKVDGGVPQGWTKPALHVWCKEVRDLVDPAKIDPATPYIGLEHMPRRSITLDQWGVACHVESSKFKFAAGDILFGKIRPYFHKVGFALTGGIASSDSIVIRTRDASHQLYALSLLSSDGFVAFASQTVREGSKMPRADWKFLSTQEFLVPTSSLLAEFTDSLHAIVAQLKNLALQNRSLARARDLLLPRLMSGELVA